MRLPPSSCPSANLVNPINSTFGIVRLPANQRRKQQEPYGLKNICHCRSIRTGIARLRVCANTPRSMSLVSVPRYDQRAQPGHRGGTEALFAIRLASVPTSAGCERYPSSPQLRMERYQRPLWLSGVEGILSFAAQAAAIWTCSR